MALTIPGYEVFESIGEGGMAEVYLGRHIRLDREVALKVMQSRMAKDPTFGDRFIREARIAAKLNHPSIVQIYDVNRYEGTFFLSMEYVKGGDLSDKLRQQLPAAQLSKVIRELCEALDYAHAQGYIHRDIKPGNILFRENGSLALSDFGIARAIHSDTHMTQTGMVVGTPSYMSPEQAQGKVLTGSSDLYSVAVIAYQMVTGQLPYKSESSISVAIKHISDPIPALPENLAAMQGFFNKALAKEPEERFENGNAMSSAFSIALSKVKDISWENQSDIETELIQAPLSDVTHSDFEAFTLERDDVSELETEVLSHGDTGTVARPISSPVAATKLKNDSALSGEVIREKEKSDHSTVQLVFLQINRIKVFFLQKNHGLALAGMLAIALLLGAGLVFLGGGNKTPEASLSPGQKIRISQLLAKADENFSSGNLIEPLGNNAFENYLAILAISPNDPVALAGIATIEASLALAAREDIASLDFTSAEKKIDKISEVRPESKEIEVLNGELVAARAKSKESFNRALEDALQAESSGNIEIAINQYNIAIQLGENSGEDLVLVETELKRIVKEQLDSANQQVSAKSLEKASSSIALAERALVDVDDEGLKSLIAESKEKLKRAEAGKTLNKKIESKLALASQAIAKDKLVEPKNDNAYDHYSSVLALQSSNKAARDGINKVLSSLDRRARSYIKNQSFSLAEKTIAQIKSRRPSDSRISALNNELAQARQLQKQKQADAKRVKDLYDRAEVYLTRNRARGADKIYRKIQLISPDDPGLKKLGNQIADSYAFLADAEIRKRDWRDVYVWVDLGLKHTPNHKKLLEQKALADKKLNR